MPKPPKLSLAAIVASATPPAKALPKTLAKPAALSAAHPGRPAQGGAEIVQLDLPAPRRGGHTLKERARQMSVYLEPPVYDQLRDLAHAERTKMHALMLEGLDLLFRQRGARSIAQLTEPEEG